MGSDRLPTLAECYTLRRREITLYHSHEPTALNFIKVRDLPYAIGILSISYPVRLRVYYMDYGRTRSQAAT